MTEFKVSEDDYQKIPAGTIIRGALALAFPDGADKTDRTGFLKKGSAGVDSSGGGGKKDARISTEVLSDFARKNKRAILFIGGLSESKRRYRNNRADWQAYIDFASVSSVVDLPEQYIPSGSGVVQFKSMPLLTAE